MILPPTPNDWSSVLAAFGTQRSSSRSKRSRRPGCFRFARGMLESRCEADVRPRIQDLIDMVEISHGRAVCGIIIAQAHRRADRAPGPCGAGEDVAWRHGLTGRF